MTTTLVLCFDAPMQSWGVRSRGILRDTAMEPTKSGVVGLLAASLGIERDDEEQIAELAALRLGIRVDREGLLERDFQTTQNVPTTMGTGHRTVVSHRYYLADALFLVALEGSSEILKKLDEAVDKPQWPIFFGRRAFVPARPLSCGVRYASLEQVIQEDPWLERSSRLRSLARDEYQRSGLRTVIDCAPNSASAQMRQDIPLSFAPGARRFVTRSVIAGEVSLTDEMITTEDLACS